MSLCNMTGVIGLRVSTEGLSFLYPSSSLFMMKVCVGGGAPYSLLIKPSAEMKVEIVAGA